MNHKYIFTIVLITVFVVLGVYQASAKINLDNASLTSLLPMMFNRWQDTSDNQAANPTGVLYVFFSNTTTDGNAGGRTGMNAICSQTDPVSHSCTRQEIENAAMKFGLYIDLPFNEMGWIDHVYNEVSDVIMFSSDQNCFGWTNNTTVRGITINNGGGKFDNATCNTTAKVACCKWIP